MNLFVRKKNNAVDIYIFQAEIWKILLVLKINSFDKRNMFNIKCFFSQQYTIQFKINKFKYAWFSKILNSYAKMKYQMSKPLSLLKPML